MGAVGEFRSTFIQLRDESLIFFPQDALAEDPDLHGAVFAPVVLGSDKTTVSVGTGQNEYYPLYASLGNAQNHLRRAHKGAVTVIGFLSIPKSSQYFPSSASNLVLMQLQPLPIIKGQSNFANFGGSSCIPQ